jgi:ABC-type sugar transport system ATPase subunit
VQSSEIVKMDAVSKAFPGVLALDRVTFNCAKGEIHALVGENGAGKSTLIKILGGVFPPDSGSIFLNDQKMSFKSPHAAQRAGIMIVHQEFSLVPYMSVTDNILLGQEYCRFGLVKSRAMRQKAAQALKMVKAPVAPDSLVIDLSASQQKLVEIAKALVANPDILIVDEPTAPLNKTETVDFFNVLAELKAQGSTIVYISHHLEEIFQIADRVTVLKDGKKVSTKQIGDSHIDELIRMMIGRELGDMFPEKEQRPRQDPILSVRNIGRANELYDISFELQKGEILGIAGLQGQGQDTLLRTIFGALEKNTGDIVIEGRPEAVKNPKQAIAAGMSLVTDKRGSEGLCLDLSVRNNLALPTIKQRRWFGTILTKEEDAVLQNTISDLNIQSSAYSKIVKFLSGGNQQKIVVGKWLIADPRIMLFINPTTGIDVGAKTEFYRHMRRFAKKRDIGIVMVTSDMLELLGLCDRILVMYDGRIVSEIDGEKATEEDIMRAAVGRTNHSQEMG